MPEAAPTQQYRPGTHAKHTVHYGPIKRKIIGRFPAYSLAMPALHRAGPAAMTGHALVQAEKFECN